MAENNSNDFNSLFQNSQNLTPLQSSFTPSGNIVYAESGTSIANQVMNAVHPVLNRMMQEISGLRKEVQDLKQEVRKLRSGSNAAKTLVMPQKPFAVLEDFLEFEKKLQEDTEFADSFQNELLTVAKTPNFVKNCWRKIFKDNLAEKLCWKGTEEKKSVRNLSTAKAIRNAAISSGETEDIFIKTTKSFFQYAKNRQSLREGYAKKTSNKSIEM